MRTRKQTLLAGGFVVVVVAVALGVVVMARTPVERTAAGTDPSQGELAKTPSQAAVASGSAGVRAFIDPQTGTLTNAPSSGRRVTGRRPLGQNRNARGLVQHRLSNGAVAVDLQGRFHTSLVATVNADGSVTTRCLAHPDASEPHEHGPEPDAEAAVEDPS